MPLIERYKPGAAAESIKRLAASRDQFDALFIPEQADQMQAVAQAIIDQLTQQTVDCLLEAAFDEDPAFAGELAVIIGKEGRNIAEADAFDHVAGYSCYNDGSIREWQFHAKQIASGKNFESTGGFGPWMVTADEIKPNQELKLVTRLNGVVEQSSHTGHMIFPIAKLISYASTIFTLVPGDVIATGTPAGVGWSRKPPKFMKPGDVCEVEIEHIGTLVNQIAAQA